MSVRPGSPAFLDVERRAERAEEKLDAIYRVALKTELTAETAYLRGFIFGVTASVRAARSRTEGMGTPVASSLNRKEPCDG